MASRTGTGQRVKRAADADPGDLEPQASKRQRKEPATVAESAASASSRTGAGGLQGPHSSPPEHAEAAERRAGPDPTGAVSQELQRPVWTGLIADPNDTVVNAGRALRTLDILMGRQLGEPTERLILELQEVLRAGLDPNAKRVGESLVEVAIARKPRPFGNAVDDILHHRTPLDRAIHLLIAHPRFDPNQVKDETLTAPLQALQTAIWQRDRDWPPAAVRWKRELPFDVPRHPDGQANIDGDWLRLLTSEHFAGHADTLLDKIAEAPIANRVGLYQAFIDRCGQPVNSENVGLRRLQHLYTGTLLDRLSDAISRRLLDDDLEPARLPERTATIVALRRFLPHVSGHESGAALDKLKVLLWKNAARSLADSGLFEEGQNPFDPRQLVRLLREPNEAALRVLLSSGLDPNLRIMNRPLVEQFILKRAQGGSNSFPTDAQGRFVATQPIDRMVQMLIAHPLVDAGQWVHPQLRAQGPALVRIMQHDPVAAPPSTGSAEAGSSAST